MGKPFRRENWDEAPEVKQALAKAEGQCRSNI
jgi:hypothetical protein